MTKKKRKSKENNGEPFLSRDMSKDELLETIRKLQDEVKRAENEIQRVTREKEDIEDEIQRVTREKESIEEENRRIEDEIQRVTREKEDVEEENRRIEDEIQRVTREKEDVEEENKILREILASREVDYELILQERKELTRRVNMNSTNSSKPPSSDGYRKPAPKSLRKRTGLKQGGQAGHKGHNIIVPDEPDVIVDHYPGRCITCPRLESCKEGSILKCGERRNVLDIEIKLKVTQHRSYKAECPMRFIGNIEGRFPDDVKAHAQYGDSFAILASIFDSFGYISDKRNSEILAAITGTSISPATIESLTARCARKVAPALTRIREVLYGEKVTHHDETGIHVDGKLCWVHNTSTPRYTIQTIHPKRGREGIDAHSAVPNPEGTAVHDCWKPYFSYEGRHALCCAHLLRELTGIEELEPEHTWAPLMKDHLVFMKSMKDSSVDCGRRSLTEDQLEYCSERYDEIMQIADLECPVIPDTEPGKRGRKRKGRERSLIERLIDMKDSVCAFIRDFDIPFDNNQAERDVRYIKVKSKVSGGFKKIGKVQEWLDVSSFMSTARKNGIGPFKALVLAFEGRGDAIIC